MKLACGVVIAALALSAAPPAQRDLVDLKRIGHIESKGRVQEQSNPVVEALIKAGPAAAVPFLISKLEDNTRISGAGTVLDFWPRVEVGHVAFLILCDLFTQADWRTTTVPGLNWADVLEGHDPDIPSWQRYSDFIEKHSRAGLRKKVEQLLAPYKDKLVWDATERCFRPRTSSRRLVLESRRRR